MKHFLSLLLVVSLCTACAKKSAAPAEEPKKAATAEQPAPPQLSPEEMMKRAKEAATPGEQHKILEKLAGNWKTTNKFWMDPSKEPEVTKGSAKHEMIMGKRFLSEHYKGKFMGQAFTGQGLLGYDNVQKKYSSIWYDTMGTGIMTGTGDYDAATNSITFQNEFFCPMTDGKMNSRTVIRFVGPKDFVFEMFGPGPDGKEAKMMEINYKK